MKKNCPKCGNKEVKLNWKNDKWKQKFKCKKCNFYFINRDRKITIIKTEKYYQIKYLIL